MMFTSTPIDSFVSSIRVSLSRSQESSQESLMLEYSNQIIADNYYIKIDDTFTLSQAEVRQMIYSILLLLLYV